MHSRSKSRMEEARDILANIILCHVPVHRYNFHAKASHEQSRLCHQLRPGGV